MNVLRRVALISLLVLPAACGKSGSSGGGPPAAPPPPPVITGPGPTLPPAYVNVPVTPTAHTGTGTGTLFWSTNPAYLPPGITLSPSGVYSGTPTVVGFYIWSVTLTDANGTDSEYFEQLVATVAEEVEPNNSPGQASVMPPGIPGSGNLGANDVDYWSFSGTSGQVVEVEVLGIRREFAAWDLGGALPRISIFGPDGTSYLIGHDAGVPYSAGVTIGWRWGLHDMDIPRFRIPQNGTYFVRMEPDLVSTPGGDYLVRINPLSLGAIQVESESNNVFGNADVITPGTIQGTRVDSDDDLFSFTITTPTIVYFEIFAYRNGVGGVGGAADDDYFDPRLALIDSDQATFLAINDDAWFFYDSAIQFLISTPGTYYLLVTESGYGCAGDGEYFLTYSQTALGGMESESNDTTGTADPIAYGDRMSGTMTTSTFDLDFFSFTGAAGDMIRVLWFDSANNQDSVDIVNVTVTEADGVTPIVGWFGRADNAYQAGMNCLRGILPAAGTYYVVVWGETSDTDYSFQLVRFKDAVFESENNDTVNSPDQFITRAAGVIGTSGDVDMFVFPAEEGEVVILSIYAGSGSQSDGFYSLSNYGSELLPDIRIVNAGSPSQSLAQTLYAGANLSGESITNGLATSELMFISPVTAWFIVEVTASDGTFGPSHLYVLEKR